MSADPHTANSAPRNGLSAPESASTPLAGVSRRSDPLNGPQAGAQSLGSERETAGGGGSPAPPATFVLWLDASDGSVPTHDGVQWPDGTATIHHRHFGITTTHHDPGAASHAAHGKQGRIVWPDAAPTT